MSGRSRWFVAVLLVSTCLTCGIGYRFLPYRMRQSDLDTWSDERPFDRTAWLDKVTTDDCARPGIHYVRGMMIDDLNNRYDLYRMKQSEIRALMGPPDGHRPLKGGLGLWEYELGIWSHHRGNYMTLIFNGDRVQALNYNGQFDGRF